MAAASCITGCPVPGRDGPARGPAIVTGQLIADGAGPASGAGHTIPVQARSVSMRFTGYSFGSIRVDGVTYDH